MADLLGLLNEAYGGAGLGKSLTDLLLKPAAIGENLGFPRYSHKADGVTLLPTTGVQSLVDYNGVLYQDHSCGFVFPQTVSITGFTAGFQPPSSSAPSSASIVVGAFSAGTVISYTDGNDVALVQAYYSGGVLDPYGVPTTPATLQYVDVFSREGVEKIGANIGAGTGTAVLGEWDVDYLPDTVTPEKIITTTGLYVIIRNKNP
jgi:hypothetical protein